MRVLAEVKGSAKKAHKDVTRTGRAILQGFKEKLHRRKHNEPLKEDAGTLKPAEDSSRRNDESFDGSAGTTLVSKKDDVSHHGKTEEEESEPLTVEGVIKQPTVVKTLVVRISHNAPPNSTVDFATQQAPESPCKNDPNPENSSDSVPGTGGNTDEHLEKVIALETFSELSKVETFDPVIETRALQKLEMDEHAGPVEMNEGGTSAGIPTTDEVLPEPPVVDFHCSPGLSTPPASYVTPKGSDTYKASSDGEDHLEAADKKLQRFLGPPPGFITDPVTRDLQISRCHNIITTPGSASTVPSQLIDTSCADKKMPSPSPGYRLTSSLRVVSVGTALADNVIVRDFADYKPTVFELGAFADGYGYSPDVNTSGTDTGMNLMHTQSNKPNQSAQQQQQDILNDLQEKQEHIQDLERQLRLAKADVSELRTLYNINGPQLAAAKEVLERAIKDNGNLAKRLGRTFTEATYYMGKLQRLQSIVGDGNLPHEYEKDNHIEKLQHEILNQERAAKGYLSELKNAQAAYVSALDRKDMEIDGLRDRIARRELQSGRVMHQHEVLEENISKYIEKVTQSTGPTGRAELQKVLNTAQGEAKEWRKRYSEGQAVVEGLEKKLCIKEHQLLKADQETVLQQSQVENLRIELDQASAKRDEFEARGQNLELEASEKVKNCKKVNKELEEENRELKRTLDKIMIEKHVDHFRAWYAEKDRRISRLEADKIAQAEQIETLLTKLHYREMYLPDGIENAINYEPNEEMWRQIANHAQRVCGAMDPNPLLQAAYEEDIWDQRSKRSERQFSGYSDYEE
ncbi:MAG: hypothetical protein LQ340_005376 [Diploschistes diacapsis]|nr:MAG: hypothetical protein LQ340_005376 [Diploschistes diacapsis]